MPRPEDCHGRRRIRSVWQSKEERVKCNGINVIGGVKSLASPSRRTAARTNFYVSNIRGGAELWQGEVDPVPRATFWK